MTKRAAPTSNPWSKFFWNDYESDPCLRICSLAAQGLWMRMLCLAAKADPVGFVKVGPTPCTVADLAKLAGEREETVEGLLAELERAGVYSRTRAGATYCRRMVKDAKRRQINQKNGSTGGNPSLSKTTEKPQSDIHHPNQSDNRPPNPQKPEARSQKPEEDSGGGSAGGRPPSEILDQIADNIRLVFEAAGWNWDDPTFTGNGHRLEAWLAAGFDLQLDILPTIQRITAGKRDGPAKSLRYFENAIGRAHADRLSPVEKLAQPQETANGHDVQTAAERSAKRLEAALARLAP